MQKNQLTFSMMQIMENWKLSDQEQIDLLDLQPLKPRHVYLYRKGDKSFDRNKSTIRRVWHLLDYAQSWRD